MTATIDLDAALWGASDFLENVENERETPKMCACIIVKTKLPCPNIAKWEAITVCNTEGDTSSSYLCGDCKIDIERQRMGCQPCSNKGILFSRRTVIAVVPL